MDISFLLQTLVVLLTFFWAQSSPESDWVWQAAWDYLF